MSSTLSPTDMELKEENDVDYDNGKQKKKRRFNSPMRKLFNRKCENDNDGPYYKLKGEKNPYSDLQFQERPSKIPIQAIVLAAVLFLVGTVMITLGSLMLTGYIKTQYSDRTWPLILVGSLVFIPGFYHIRIAYWAWKGDKSFSFADIPDLELFD